jgi:hypothetical protein
MVLLLIYFLPAIVASMRRHRQSLAIGILNLVAGWTFVGWVVAIVWACTADTKARSSANLGSPEEISLHVRSLLFSSKSPQQSPSPMVKPWELIDQR